MAGLVTSGVSSLVGTQVALSDTVKCTKRLPCSASLSGRGLIAFRAEAKADISSRVGPPIAQLSQTGSDRRKTRCHSAISTGTDVQEGEEDGGHVGPILRTDLIEAAGADLQSDGVLQTLEMSEESSDGESRGGWSGVRQREVNLWQADGAGDKAANDDGCEGEGLRTCILQLASGLLAHMCLLVKCLLKPHSVWCLPLDRSAAFLVVAAVDRRPQLLAAVDMGTNSFHMVVVRAHENGRFEIEDVEKEDVRLGSGR